MASRRLDISSLLCDDKVPEPVVLAPHLRQQTPSSSSSYPRHAPSPTTSPAFSPPSHMLHPQRPSSHHQPTPSLNSYPPAGPSQFPSPPSSKLQSFGLEALVQAATEERRRLSGTSTESDIQSRPSPPVEQRLIPQYQHSRQHRSPDNHVRSPTQHHPSIIHPVQPQMVRSPTQAIRSPVQLIRSPVYQSLAQHQPQSRQRVQDKHYSPLDELLVCVEDEEYPSPHSVYVSPPLQPQPVRQQVMNDHHRAQQQLELDRQRMHHEQLLLQEQRHQQQQRYVREHQTTYIGRQAAPLPPSHPPRGPSLPLHMEHSPYPQHHQPLPRPPLMAQQHTAGRKSDPGQLRHLLHADPAPPLSAPTYPQAAIDSDEIAHPNKRRRYSDSPAHLLSAEDKDRIHREREKMAIGDLGFGRPEPVGSPAAIGPRRPGSGHGRKHLGLVDLMAPKHELPIQPVAASLSVDGPNRNDSREGNLQEGGPREHVLREIGLHQGSTREGNSHPITTAREGYRHAGPHEATPRDGSASERDPPEGGLRDRHRILSPPRRRSPPGSHTGRAIAAKKTEDVEHSLHDLLSHVTEPPQSLEKDRKSPLLEKESKPISHEKEIKRNALQKLIAPVEKELKIMVSDKETRVVAAEKETRKRLPSRSFIDHSTAAEPVPFKKQRTAPAPPVPTPKATEEDAHEWFLEHFDDDNVPPQSQTSRVPTPPLVPASSRTTGSPVPKSRTPTPPEAVDTLEQELEELLADPPHVSKTEPDMDMDVDLVTELVADTLDADDAKVEDVGMEVDVEDELLSLLDDHPSVRRPVASKSIIASPTVVKPLPPRAESNGARPVSPSVTSGVSASTPAAFLSPIVRASSTRPTSERGSMPPPASVVPVRGKDKEDKPTERSVSVTAPASKKKNALSKSLPKNKSTAAVSAGTTSAKSRARPGPKPKLKTSDASLSATAAKLKTVTGPKKAAASRSRSTSAMPSGSAGPESSETKAEKQEEEEESDHEDDKLYCVCKTTYDEDRFMIACDRCDDWYHTQCVNMPDLEVDLVDQFFCPPCVEKHPTLNLKTTYKTRCLYGRRHSDPSSSKACHRPARGAFSKYCSDECGLKYMQARADAWAKKGGKKDKLWETVKDAEQREGVVVCAGDTNGIKADPIDKDTGDHGLKQKKGKVEREVERLNGLLDSVVRLREDIKKEMEGVIWREKLLELATGRAEQIGECGWDQRLCLGDDECADLGARALESYDANAQDGDQPTPSGKWWCSGNKACDRHAGWQAVRGKDVCKEKEKKNDALLNLTTRERAIRKRIEDILDPHGRNCNEPSGKSPLKASNAKVPNGHTKGKMNGDTTTKKGKKRKAPS